MDLLKLGAQIFLSKLGSNGSGMDLGSVVSALSGLLPTSKNGDLDLSSLLSKMDGGGLASMAASFLGDGPNEQFSASNLLSLLGDSNVSNFASQLGLQKDTAVSGLSSMIPELIDQQSKGGSLLSGAGSSLISGLASKFFK